MITGKSLSNEECKFLCNTIIRLHKENGCFNALKRKYTTSEKLSKKLSEEDRRPLCVNLIDPIWQIVCSTHIAKGDGEKLSVITASIEMLKFIDKIYNSEYSIFYGLSAELVKEEFGYISTTINDLVELYGFLNKVIPMEMIDELKNFYKKFHCYFSALTKINIFEE